mmetsp:Transcript_4548/g.5910  ORF Transcript_4548/g.5910 Transcript_4548/m.5910 type:complete len:314 (-) Transcript_4548:105-1046(-)|eukprot:CAMPEP_0117784108 /NCGR_PEP_ID=MMETSP0948-20121206/4452_1 /TAXON_ID=44440 /ORGANISM="Chattonella subsalsa, Strain CCMP2191" /LENGTH=313 /DNA_ID=CAMNT_0005612681 /DNA_START=146 /DNA_END=1087 /DNA_ORIENTATION=+
MPVQRHDMKDRPTSLFQAIYDDYLQDFEQTVIDTVKQKKLYATSISGNTAFHYAILFESYEALVVMLQYVVSSECFTKQNDAGCTILQLSAIQNCTEMVEIICHHKFFTHTALNNLHPETQNTALHWAAIHGNINLLNILTECGADIRAKNIKGETVVFKAVQYDRANFLDLLLLRDPQDLEQRNVHGTTPLILAVQNQSLDCLKVLLKHIPHPTNKNTSVVNALELAIKLKYKDTAIVLAKSMGHSIPQELKPQLVKLIGWHTVQIHRMKQELEYLLGLKVLCCVKNDDTDDDLDSVSVALVEDDDGFASIS